MHAITGAKPFLVFGFAFPNDALHPERCNKKMCPNRRFPCNASGILQATTMFSEVPSEEGVHPLMVGPLLFPEDDNLSWPSPSLLPSGWEVTLKRHSTNCVSSVSSTTNKINYRSVVCICCVCAQPFGYLVRFAFLHAFSDTFS